MQEFEPFGGTPDYSSATQLCERTTGPADDLESLGYTWLSMLHPGGLPWNFVRDVSDPSTPYSSRAALIVGPFSSSAEHDAFLQRQSSTDATVLCVVRPQNLQGLLLLKAVTTLLSCSCA